MLFGCASALVAWESADFLLTFKAASTELLDARLVFTIVNWPLAVASGPLLATQGLNLQFHLPFGRIAVLAWLVMYGMYRIFSCLGRV